MSVDICHGHFTGSVGKPDSGKLSHRVFALEEPSSLVAQKHGASVVWTRLKLALTGLCTSCMFHLCVAKVGVLSSIFVFMSGKLF